MTDDRPTGVREGETQLFRLLVENLPDHAIFTVDPEGQIQSWNSSGERLFGHSANEILTHSVSQFFASDDVSADRPQRELTEARTAGRVCTERWCLRKDGSRFWASITITPLRDESGPIQGFGILVRDVTERKRAEEAARASEERFRGLMGQAPFSVQVFDATGRTLRVNRAWEELWGVTLDQISDYNVLQDPQLEIKGVLPYLRRAFAGQPACIPAIQYDPNETLPGRTRHTDPRRWVAAIAYPIKDDAGHVREVILIHEDVTERKRTLEALRESEQRFVRFMQHLPGLAWIKDREGRYIYANDAAEKAFGTPRAQLYGKTDEELFPPATAAQFRENDRRAVETGGVQTFESLEHPDGVSHYSLVSKFPIPGSDDRPAFVGGVAIDVTDLRRSENARQFLAEAGTVLSSSLDYEVTLSAVARLVVPRLADWCSVYVVDTGGGLRRLVVAHSDPEKMKFAEEYARRYPPSPEDPRGVSGVIRSGEPVLTPEVTDQMLVAVARDADHLTLLRGLGLRSAMIIPLITRGRRVGAITFGAAESGRRYGSADLALAQELGERAALAVDNARLFHESEEALHRLGVLIEASGRLTNSLELPAVQSAILDLSHRLVAADAYAVWRLDAAANEWRIADSANLSEAYLKNSGRISAPGHQIPERPVVAEDAQAAEGLESRRQMYQAEGIESVLAVPLRHHGCVVGTLVFYYRTRRKFDDVTVRVATALADLAGAALATSELYQRESELRRRAEEADKAKDAFLAALGHELRNPLTVIVTGLHTLRERGANALDRIPAMERQADVLGRLVDDLLDMARVTQGRIELRREPVRVSEVVAHAIETVRPLIDAHQHSITVDLPTDELWLDADAVRLTQCISNLLHNAAKYTPPGGRITVTAVRNGTDVVLRVRDNGIGIPPTDLVRIFELFVQVRDARTHSPGGLGIGLSLVQRLVEMMGGSVLAQSAGVGTGSEFQIRLPVGAAASKTPASHPETAPARSLRVVIADDNVDAAETLAVLVELWSHSVQVAYDGPGAVAATREFRPDVCLFDIGMPGFDGYEAARQVRADAGLAGVVLVAMTGYGQDSDRERSLAAGFDHFLVKPVAPAEIERLLRTLGQEHRGD